MPHKVQVNTGQTNVSLPNGYQYNAGAQVILTDEQFSRLAGDVFTKNVAPANTPALLDLGAFGVTTNVAANVAALGSPTSSQNSTTAATSQTTAYVQTDVQTIRTLANALQTSYNAAQVDIAALFTKVNAIRTALVNSGAMTGP